MDDHATAELTAARIALEGSSLEKLALSVRALTAILRDPDDTRQVFLLGLSANARRLPWLLAQFALDDDGDRLLRERPAIDSRTVDWDALRALPDGTLGREYARYLDEHHLDPDLFQAPPGLPPTVAWLAQRIRQTHDIWHVLTGCAPDVPGEIALQAFTYGQMGMPSAGLIALFGTLRFGLRHRRLARDVVRGVAHGRRARFLATVVFEDRWARPLGEVRRELGVVPLAA